MKKELKFTPDETKSAKRIFWGPLRRNDRNQVETDKVKFLKKIPFFADLNKHQLEQVSKVVYERRYEEGEYIFELNQPGAALFIIQSGEIAVEIAHASGDVTTLAVLGKTAFFGELALLDESPRSASARAQVTTHVLALFRKDLDNLTKTDPDISTGIYKSLATIIGNRLKATNDLIEKKLKVAA